MSERRFIDAVAHRLRMDPSFAADLSPELRERLVSDDDELSDVLFSEREDVLTVGWGADTMGASGCFGISEWHGIYVIQSSDDDPAGPFGSIEEALAHDLFQRPAPGLGLSSSVASEERLMEIGERLFHENDNWIDINDLRYRRGPNGLEPVQKNEQAD